MLIGAIKNGTHLIKNLRKNWQEQSLLNSKRRFVANSFDISAEKVNKMGDRDLDKVLLDISLPMRGEGQIQLLPHVLHGNELGKKLDKKA